MVNTDPLNIKIVSAKNFYFPYSEKSKKLTDSILVDMRDQLKQYNQGNVNDNIVFKLSLLEKFY